MNTNNKTKTFFHITQNLCLIFVILFICIQATFFNPSFYKSILKDTSFDADMRQLLITSFDNYYVTLENEFPKIFNNHKTLLAGMQDYFNANVYSNSCSEIIDGLFDYITGKTNTLPTLKLEHKPNVSLDEDTPDARKINTVFQKMDSINLDTILVLLNRTDIYTYIDFARILRYIIANGTGLFLITYIILCIICKAAFKETIPKQASKQLKSSSIVAISISIFVSLALFSFTAGDNFIFLKSLFPASQSITDYLHKANILWLLISIGLCISIFIIANYLKLSKLRLQIKSKPIRISIIIICFFIAFSSWAAFLRDITHKQVFFTIEKALGFRSSMKMIPAESRNIFDIKVKVLDKKTKKPVKNAKISLSELNDSHAKLVSKKLTNSNGQLVFHADKGLFMLSTDKTSHSQNEYLEIDETGTYVVMLFI